MVGLMGDDRQGMKGARVRLEGAHGPLELP